MNFNGLDQARVGLSKLEGLDYSNRKIALENADRLINHLNQFPALLTDGQSSEDLRKITAVIYSIKDLLPQEKQKKATQLFNTIHHLKPTPIENLLQNEHPAMSLAATHKDAESILCDKQEYTIPMKLLTDEVMPCKTYFKPIQVELKDGSEVRISQGLLARFSGLVKTMVSNEKRAPKLVLDQLNRHQFDSLIAFLETGEEGLINQDNVLPLLSTATHLQIPTMISYLEEQISTDLLSKINFYKENLKIPIRLVLSGSEINDDTLKLLIGLPISELELVDCPNLTKKCLPIIGQMATVKTLSLGSNDWVDDEVLANIPPHIETLSLATCSKFTGKGLAKLTSVLSLELFGCDHLQDKDLAQLSDQFESLNLAMCRKIGEKTLKKLGSMHKLKHLTLTGDINITDQSLEVLTKNLLTLKVSGCSLTEGAFKPISKMTKLQELAMCSTNINGKGLPSLPLSLVRLHLDGCKNLTDTVILPLAKRENLKYIGIDQCPNITGEFTMTFSKTPIEVGWQPPQDSNFTRNVISESFK